MKKVLLHACCGPCLIYPFESLSGQGYSPTAFWHNPNIFPEDEHQRRRDSLVQYCNKHNIELIIAEYNRRSFYDWVFKEDLPGGNRCNICWQKRLEETAIYAKENGFNSFTTTLLVSTYQDVDTIMEIGRKTGEKYNIEFLALDFRSGFEYAHCRAKDEGLYSQKWCGCVYSFNARLSAMVRRNRKR